LEIVHRIPPGHVRALDEIRRRLQDKGILWAVTGSVGLAMQGMDAEVHDLDLQTDAAGAYAIERCLSEFVTRPVRFCEAARIRSHLGALSVHGILVEIMGDVQKRTEDGTWEEPPDLQLRTQWVQAFGMQLPVMSLEWEQQAYLKLGRAEKAQRIKRHLEERARQPG